MLEDNNTAVDVDAQQLLRTPYKRHGGDKRGNNVDRRRRKMWMLGTFGDGSSAACCHCGCGLDYSTIEADRIVPGGSYRRDNIQPSCRTCNLARSDDADWSATG